MSEGLVEKTYYSIIRQTTQKGILLSTVGTKYVYDKIVWVKKNKKNSRRTKVIRWLNVDPLALGHH